MFSVTNPAIGSWRCTTSNDSCWRSRLIRCRNQMDSDILAIDPPLGTGTARPIGMKSGSSIPSGAVQGATTRTSCPRRLNSPPRALIWSFTPPWTA